MAQAQCVRMWLAQRIRRAVRVSVMLVMDMRMRVHHQFVVVFMNVLFGQMQP